MAKRVFLSFVVEDLDLVNLFRGQAKNKNNDLEFDDYSVKEPFDSDDAAYIRSQIKERISRASLLVCLIGTTTYKSRWVSWEITTADDLNKTVGGVRLHSDSSKDSTPKALSDASGKVMDWDIDAIVKWMGT